jgi:hypothetical protein
LVLTAGLAGGEPTIFHDTESGAPNTACMSELLACVSQGRGVFEAGHPARIASCMISQQSATKAVATRKTLPRRSSSTILMRGAKSTNKKKFLTLFADWACRRR